MATQDTIDAVRRAAFLLRGITELADHLEKVASIEQSESEARGRLNGIGKQIESAQAELAQVQASIAGVNAEAEQTLAMARQGAEQIKAAAEFDAKAVVDEANGVATDTLKESQEKAGKLVAEAEERARKSSAAADAADARKAAAEKACADKSAELQELLRKLDAAKARAAELLR